MTWEIYEKDLDSRIDDLHSRIQQGAYRAQPSRRTYIPKEDGSRRPLAVTALEDKIVQRATAAVLNAIYEEELIGFSGRIPAEPQPIRCVGRADCRNNQQECELHFGRRHPVVLPGRSQEWAVRFLEHRIGDKRMIRLIQKWFRAGVLEDGIVTIEERGLWILERGATGL